MAETIPGGRYVNAQGQLVNANGEPITEAKSLSDHTVPQLKEIASGLNIEGASSMKKDELIEAIEAAEPA